MTKSRYWITKPTSEYSGIIDFCCTRCTTFSFVVNERAGASQAAIDLIENAKVSFKEIRDQITWPGGGTLIDGYSCQVYYIEVSGDSIQLLKTVDGLYDWVHPNMPEDLAFYRPDEEPFFVVVGHEGISFFDIDEEELTLLKSEIPGLELSKLAPL